MKNLFWIALSSCLAFSAFADDYGYAPFKPGAVFPVGELTWGYLPDGSACQVRIPQSVKVTRTEKVKGDQDWIYFKLLQKSFGRDAECPAGKEFRMRIVGADTLREKSTDRVLMKKDIKTVLKGKSPIHTRSGLSAGDRFGIQNWFWAVTIADERNSDTVFREDDLCRILPDESVEIVGFPENQGAYGYQALMQYFGPKPASGANCPNGMLFLEYVDDITGGGTFR